MHNELFEIYCEQNPDPKDQRERLVKCLRTGVDLHATDKNAVTALIEHGANVNQVCRISGSTPLHRAVTTTGAPSTAGKRQEAVEIIRLLIAAGADSSITNKSGRRPADYVKDETTKSLLKNRTIGASPVKHSS